LTVYLGKRDFVDHIDVVDPVDGVVLVDPEYLKERKVRQYADICLFNTAQYKCPVAVEDADDMVAPSSTFCKVYTLTPFLANNREKRGLALDGKLKHEDTNLASSTLLRDGANKEILGIIVSYKVKVKLVVSRGGDVAVELPFTLMHPKPREEPAHRD
ncbi:UNVERIFIED_CONTAM: hypothetical protein H355_003284, partial [Colinus virginianus]